MRVRAEYAVTSSAGEVLSRWRTHAAAWAACRPYVGQRVILLTYTRV